MVEKYDGGLEHVNCKTETVLRKRRNLLVNYDIILFNYESS